LLKIAAWSLAGALTVDMVELLLQSCDGCERVALISRAQLASFLSNVQSSINCLVPTAAAYGLLHFAAWLPLLKNWDSTLMWNTTDAYLTELWSLIRSICGMVNRVP